MLRSWRERAFGDQSPVRAARPPTRVPPLSSASFPVPRRSSRWLWRLRRTGSVSRGGPGPGRPPQRDRYPPLGAAERCRLHPPRGRRNACPRWERREFQGAPARRGRILPKVRDLDRAFRAERRDDLPGRDGWATFEYDLRDQGGHWGDARAGKRGNERTGIPDMRTGEARAWQSRYPLPELLQRLGERIHEGAILERTASRGGPTPRQVGRRTRHPGPSPPGSYWRLSPSIDAVPSSSFWTSLPVRRPTRLCSTPSPTSGPNGPGSE